MAGMARGWIAAMFALCVAVAVFLLMYLGVMLAVMCWRCWKIWIMGVDADACVS
jgi:hypothetical protein